MSFDDGDWGAVPPPPDGGGLWMLILLVIIVALLVGSFVMVAANCDGVVVKNFWGLPACVASGKADR